MAKRIDIGRGFAAVMNQWLAIIDLGYTSLMRTLVATLTALMLFATTPVVAGDFEDGLAAYRAGDYQKAFRLFKPLAKQGNAEAQYGLGLMYDKGMGVPEDDAKAVHWWTRAAKQGDAEAQNILGWINEKGGDTYLEQGVPVDHAKAVHWYSKAAKQGRGDAQFSLGRMYFNGTGVPQDYAKAVHWYTKAAKQGNTKAQLIIGTMHNLGRGVPEDYVRGYAWLSIAAARGDADGKKVKEFIAKRMTPTQIAEAQKLSRELWEKYVVPFQKD